MKVDSMFELVHYMEKMSLGTSTCSVLHCESSMDDPRVHSVCVIIEHVI